MSEQDRSILTNQETSEIPASTKEKELTTLLAVSMVRRD
jgi:hypothetical protein